MSATADFSDKAHALLENGYRIVPIRPQTKRPTLPEWQRSSLTASDIPRFSGHGWGVLCGQGDNPIAGVDIDSTHPDLVAKVVEWFRVNVDTACQRTGKAPKTLLVFRASEPGWKKMTSRAFTDAAGQQHRLEILGDGQQFVAYGIHPDTRQPYQWVGDFVELAQVEAKLHTTMTRELAQAGIAAFEQLALDAGLTPTSPPTSPSVTTAANHATPLARLDPTEITNELVSDLRSALNHLRADDRQLWVRVAHALWELDDTGRELWLSWSQTSEKFDAADAARVWDSLRPTSTGHNAVFAESQRAGWKNPRSAPAKTNASNGSTGVLLTRAADVTPEPVAWLWRDWLARGKLHIVAGAPGTGKTSLMLALAAVVSAGGRWPDGTHADAGDVLIWSGEDDPADTLRPRLEACGADLSRVHIISATWEADASSRAFDPATDLPLLEEEIRKQNFRPALLIVDPVVSVVTGDSHKNTETRRNLQPLVDLGQRLRCAIVGITHFSKGTAGRDVVERVTGSVAFGALARVVLATAKLPDEQDGGRLLVRAKSNIGPDKGGFGYELEQYELPGHAGLFAQRVRWGEPVDGNARELLADAEATHEGKREGGQGAAVRAASWLTSFLAAGPKQKRDVEAATAEAGHKFRTVQRAATGIGVEFRRDGFGGGAIWSLSVAPNEPQSRQHLELGALGVNDLLGLDTSSPPPASRVK